MPQAVLQEDGVRVSLPHVPAPDLGDGTDGKTGPNLEKAVRAHFNGPGHKVSDMSVTILEKVWNRDPMFMAVTCKGGLLDIENEFKTSWNEQE